MGVWYIAHSGTAGMHWYHRFHQSYKVKPTRSGKVGQEHFHVNKSLNRKDPNNKENVKKINYNGDLFFISENKFDDDTIIKPRVPNNFFTKYGYENNKDKRICFTDDPGKCLIALSYRTKGKEYYVYKPDKKYAVYKPNHFAVPDSDITNELWIKRPIKVKNVGKIKCIGDAGKDGMKFNYGNNSAELYEWDWKCIEKNKRS